LDGEIVGHLVSALELLEVINNVVVHCHQEGIIVNMRQLLLWCCRLGNLSVDSGRLNL
jgi:hypothetical protein